MDNKQLTLAMFAYKEKGMLNTISKEVKEQLANNLELNISNLEYAKFEGGTNTLYIIKIDIKEYKEIKMLLDEKIKMKVDDYYLILSKSTEELNTVMAIIDQHEENEY